MRIAACLIAVIFLATAVGAVEAPIFDLTIQSNKKESKIQFRVGKTSLRLDKSSRWSCKFEAKESGGAMINGLLSCTTVEGGKQIPVSETIACPRSVEGALGLLGQDASQTEIEQFYDFPTRDLGLSDKNERGLLKVVMQCHLPGLDGVKVK